MWGLRLVSDHSETGGAGAMLMEMTAAQFLAGYDCSLYTLGHLEDRHYSFGFRRGSVYTRRFSQLLLQLAEVGKISRARDFWWPQPSGCSQAGQGDAVNTSLDLVLMSPLFILLGLAILLSCLLLLVEILTVTDRQLSSVPWYLKLRLSSTRSLDDTDQVGPRLGQTAHVATQTVLWASSRANTPGKSGLGEKEGEKSQLTTRWWSGSHDKIESLPVGRMAYCGSHLIFKTFILHK